LIILRNIRSSKGRERDNRPSPNCQCNTVDSNGQCDADNCGYNSEDEYGEVQKQCNDMEWVEVIIDLFKNIMKKYISISQPVRV